MGSNFISLLLTFVFLVQSLWSLPHVKNYEIVKPQKLQLRTKRSLSVTQVHPDEVQYQLAIEGQNHTIHLEKNRDLIGRDFTETRYTKDGKRVTISTHEEHCYYHGRIEGMPDSSVSVGTCSGISGFVRAQQKLYLIEPLGDTDEDDHAVYRHLDPPDATNSTTERYDVDQDLGPKLAGLFRSKSWKSKPTSEPDRFVELFVVVDKAEYLRYGDHTKSRILNVVNHVDKVYRSINTRIVLVGLEIWTNEDLMDVDRSSEVTLDHFLIWRQTHLLKRVKHDNAQFVTGTDFEGDTVGLANKFAMCTENSGGVNQDHHRDPIGLASTIAHEMGHNFGLSHDSPGCVCGPSLSTNCVMTDKLRTGSQSFPELFSSCSEAQLAEFLVRARPNCLHKPALTRSIETGPRCGNALLDPGEECDCGTVQECKNPCCDPSTCRLTYGSQCAHGRCCENCQFKPAGTVCRRPASECDLPEYCTGTTAACPDDSFVMNGKPCSDLGPGYCHDGQCPTHQQHCWRLFGKGAKVASEDCFSLNMQGQEGANCGNSTNGYTRCTLNNIKCGSIFCEEGGDSITGKRAVFTVRYHIKCTIAVEDDKSRNIDMVPNGTKCGSNKVCLDNKCQDVAVYGNSDDCSKKCNNHGVCNHKRECHCDPGWAPPLCKVQYADLPQGQTAVIAGVCAAVFIILLIIALVAGLICCKRDRPKNYISKSKRKVHSALEKQTPMFEKPKPRPEISQPTLMESTAAQVCNPHFVSTPPCRPAPLPPKKSPPEPPTSHSEATKPLPPVKPLPPMSKTEFKMKPSPPPVPPVKPRPPVVQKKPKENCDGSVAAQTQH
ncbi:disintegrin and metalloproteinase domain-containing protein 8 [Boleophthalmus pectinirostris]|uniref:disintegrin and metalloproteinase domain-containing protein 8 n=1 Tax=Boleophthalmus pectinirostris TaxID=150288 RepID=UPI00242EEF6C|nr:disintegrin and metalloproteinase domain-containing protein 8 [Boleophthalmus pectinirostris]